jgi:Na+-driven multidrug efflux pump
MLATPARSRRPRAAVIRPLLATGGHLTVRTVALLGAFTLASALAARFGTAALGAHQVAFELFLLLALVLDAIAIAGQILVARLLGGGEPDAAWQAAVRMIWWSVAWGVGFGAVLVALSGVGPHAFSASTAVLDDSHGVWLLLGLMQPLAAAVFALDGILIGAGDTRYLAIAMAAAFAVFVPLALLASNIDALWWALNALIVARLVTLVPRFVRRRWIVVGARAGEPVH